jgi:hypothetical protein
MSSIFNQDVKGVVYLFGLSFAILLNMAVDYTELDLFSIEGTTEGDICNKYIQFHTESNIPFSLTVYSYTFAYLLYVIVSTNILEQNVSTITFFSVLILADLLWNSFNNCYSFIASVASIIVGSGVGLLWAYVIEQANNPSLQYFVGFSDNEVCSRPAKSTFKCKVYKNGKLVKT